MIATWLITASGLLIVVAVLVDIFHTLANPGKQGLLSRVVHRVTWLLSRRRAWSGPLAMLGVIGIGALYLKPPSLSRSSGAPAAA